MATLGKTKYEMSVAQGALWGGAFHKTEAASLAQARHPGRAGIILRACWGGPRPPPPPPKKEFGGRGGYALSLIPPPSQPVSGDRPIGNTRIDCGRSDVPAPPSALPAQDTEQYSDGEHTPQGALLSHSGQCKCPAFQCNSKSVVARLAPPLPPPQPTSQHQPICQPLAEPSLFTSPPHPQVGDSLLERRTRTPRSTHQHMRYALMAQPPPPPPFVVVVRSPCQENYPADAHTSAHKSVLESLSPAWTQSVHLDAPARAAARPTAEPWSSQTGQVIQRLR